MLQTVVNFLKELLYIVPAVLIAMTVHEFSHGYVAHLLGDPTPANTGRLSLNPLHHLDPIGTLCLIFFRFGWAKPVMVDARYFDNPRRGMALVALAGPAANFLTALLSMFIWGILVKAGAGNDIVVYFLQMLIMLNLGLGVFNLIPVPPLDGSKVLGAIMPDELYFKVMQYESYGAIILMLLLYLGVLSRPMAVLRTLLWNGMASIVNHVLAL